MESQTIVVFKKEAKEIIACIPLTKGEQGICKKDVDFKIYNGTEPIFTETGNGIALNNNAFIWNGD